jgi:hypothetical protein
VRQWCDQAGLPDCTSHGLRKLMMVRLAHAGYSAPQIGAISGHKDLREIQLYIEQMDRRKLAIETMTAFEKVQTANKNLLPTLLSPRLWRGETRKFYSYGNEVMKSPWGKQSSIILITRPGSANTTSCLRRAAHHRHACGEGRRSGGAAARGLIKQLDLSSPVSAKLP